MTSTTFARPTGRAVSRPASRSLARLAHIAALAAILVLAAALRFNGLNWDAGQHLQRLQFLRRQAPAA